MLVTGVIPPQAQGRRREGLPRVGDAQSLPSRGLTRRGGEIAPATPPSCAWRRCGWLMVARSGVRHPQPPRRPEKLGTLEAELLPEECSLSLSQAWLPGASLLRYGGARAGTERGERGRAGQREGLAQAQLRQQTDLGSPLCLPAHWGAAGGLAKLGRLPPFLCGACSLESRGQLACPSLLGAPSRTRPGCAGQRGHRDSSAGGPPAAPPSLPRPG